MKNIELDFSMFDYLNDSTKSDVINQFIVRTCLESNPKMKQNEILHQLNRERVNNNLPKVEIGVVKYIKKQGYK